MGGGQTSPADLRPRRGKGVSGPRSTAGGERGPWIGPDMRKRMNRDMEINGEIVNDKVRYADLNLSPELMRARPVFTTLPGWKCDIRGVTDYGKLPQAARDYVDFIEKHIEAPITIVSTGPKRHEICRRAGN